MREGKSFDSLGHCSSFWEDQALLGSEISLQGPHSHVQACLVLPVFSCMDGLGQDIPLGSDLTPFSQLAFCLGPRISLGIVTLYPTGHARPTRSVLSLALPRWLLPQSVQGEPSRPTASIWEQGPGSWIGWDRGSPGSLNKAQVLRAESSEGGKKGISGEA